MPTFEDFKDNAKRLEKGSTGIQEDSTNAVVEKDDNGFVFYKCRFGKESIGLNE